MNDDLNGDYNNYYRPTTIITVQVFDHRTLIYDSKKAKYLLSINKCGKLFNLFFHCVCMRAMYYYVCMFML